MKKILIFILTVIMIAPTVVLAEETAVQTSLKVVLDGKEIIFPDEQPFTNIKTAMPDGSTFEETDNHIQFVPVRAICEAAGCEVSWEDETQTVTVKKGDRVTTFTVGDGCYVDGKAKTCVVNFPMKNDRVFVSQYGICHALDCEMRWDDVNRVLYFFSNEKHPEGVEWTQNGYLESYVEYSEFGEFNSMSEAGFVIPGLQETFVPQGIAYRKDTDEFYLSGYSDVAPSKIFVVNAKTGKMTAQYRVTLANGNKSTAHFSGLAIDDKSLFIAIGTEIYRISLSSIDAEGSRGDLKVEEIIKLTMGNENVLNSFIEISDGYLLSGNYYQPGKARYEKKADENFNVLIRCYKLDSMQPSGFAQKFKVENQKYDYVPEFVYELEDCNIIQGLTFVKGHIVATASQGTKASEFRVYDTTKTENTEKFVVMADKKVPVISLKLKRKVKGPSNAEEISGVGDYLYITFESSAIKMRRATNKYVVDSVIKMDLNKLLKE